MFNAVTVRELKPEEVKKLMIVGGQVAEYYITRDPVPAQVITAFVLPSGEVLRLK